MGVTLLSAGYIVFGAVSFAFVSASSQAPLAFPIVVSLWIWYLCVVVKKAVVSFSTPPHPIGRVTVITIGVSFVALVALALSIYIGLLILSALIFSRA
jgi:hypothetical protein